MPKAGRLSALPPKIRQGRDRFSKSNTLAYYGIKYENYKTKKFYYFGQKDKVSVHLSVLAPRVNSINIFTQSLKPGNLGIPLLASSCSTIVKLSTHYS